MNRKKEVFFLAALILLFILVNYSFLDDALIRLFDESETRIAERIVDGDTIVAGGENVRLLGINTPERGEWLYSEAKEYLQERIFNKTIKLEFGKERYDIYDRLLAYVFLNEENINLKIIENGYANPYFPSGKDEYSQSFYDAWKKCVSEEKNLCEASKEKCASCIEIKNLDVESQEAIFYNKCSFDCTLTGWKIKDEGRKNFVFPVFVLESEKEILIKVGDGTDTEEMLFWKGEKYVWTSTGDTLFLRDEKGKLILYYNV